MDDITNGLIETEDDLEKARVLDDQEKIARLESFRLKAADEFDEPDYTVEQNGIGFAPRGNIMALMAEMKHGKTFVNMTLAAAVLKGEFLGLKSKLENAKVVFFDTEQDKADGQRIMRRVHYVCNWKPKIDNPRFQVYHLREIDFTKRRQLIHDVIDVYRPDVVFIDGIRDLLQDFNSLEESADLIQDLMTTSSAYNCAIWTVLHVNPNSDKMRGHLGTELGNKVTDVFKVTKKKEAGCITFEVEHQAARHRDVDGWTFRINDDKPWGIPELLTEVEIRKIDDTKRNSLKEMMEAVAPSPKVYSKTAIREELRQKYKIGTKTADGYIEDAVVSEILVTVNTPHGTRYRLAYEGMPKEQDAFEQASEIDIQF